MHEGRDVRKEPDWRPSSEPGEGPHAVERLERLRPILDAIYRLEEDAFLNMGRLGSDAMESEKVRNFVDTTERNVFEWSALVKRVAGVSEQDWAAYRALEEADSDVLH